MKYVVKNMMAVRSMKPMLLALALLLLPTGAMAQEMSSGGGGIPPMLRAGTNQNLWAAFWLGPAIGLSNSGTQFKLQQDIGFHLMGGATGPALGGSLEESFGGGGFTLEVAPKFWWDIQPVNGLGLYLSPWAKMGFAMYTGGGSTLAAFNLGFGFEGKLMLNQSWLVFFRPFTIDMGIRSGVVVRYDLLFGVGYAWGA